MTSAAVASAFVVALVGVLAIERYATVLGLIDRPNERSSHVVPRPRGGGFGILCGVVAGLAVAWGAGVQFDTRVWSVLGASGIVAAAGLWDDVSPLAAGPRLTAHFAGAGLVAWTCGGLAHVPLPAPLDIPLGAAGVICAVLWMVAVTNFFNFMDGADGLAGGQACITFVAVAWVLWPLPAAVLSAIIGAATVAFLLRNWAPAKIFLGDVGSGWLGFMLAAVPFAGPLEKRESLVLLVAASLALFLADPVVTLVRRIARGAPLTASHREHAYQRLFDARTSHAPAVLGILGGAAVLSGLAVTAYERPAVGWVTLLVAFLAFAAEWLIASRRNRSGPA